MSISKTLRAAVAAALDSGWSVNSVAVAAGVQPIVLSRWLRGEKTITLDTADRLAAVLDLQLGIKSAAHPARARGRG